MAEKQLQGMRVAVLMTDGVEQVEFTEPTKALVEAGAQVIVIAPKAGEIQAFKHYDKTEKFKAEKSLNEVNAGDFDALLLPGGALNADALRVERKAQEFARQIDQVGKPIAVICHGPWLLVSAGLTRNRKTRQLSHNPRRHSQRRRKLGKLRDGARSQLGQQSSTQRYPGIQSRDVESLFRASEAKSASGVAILRSRPRAPGSTLNK